MVLVFLDGKDSKFYPSACKSVFNRKSILLAGTSSHRFVLTLAFSDIYIVVKQDPDDPDMYQVAVSIKCGVKIFGPTFPHPPKVHRSLLREFLLTKSTSLISRKILDSTTHTTAA